MNKYLFNKIEQAHSAYFENLIFIANEVCRERQSETFEEFTELEPIEIAKVLGWNTKDTTLKMIEESIKEKPTTHIINILILLTFKKIIKSKPHSQPL